MTASPLGIGQRNGQVPLSPQMRAYLRELDRWLASGFSDDTARNGMVLALAGARNQ